MSILSELTELLSGLNIPVETGVFSDVVPDDYVVITPLIDIFELHSDNQPEYETQEARLSLFSQNNYKALKSKIVTALLSAEFIITARQYIGHEDDSNYHHYAIDVAKIYDLKGH
jgi:hypothetical protein